MQPADINIVMSGHDRYNLIEYIDVFCHNTNLFMPAGHLYTDAINYIVNVILSKRIEFVLEHLTFASKT